MARVSWGIEFEGWFVEDTGSHILVAVREVTGAQGNRLAVAVADDVAVAFKAVNRPYEWATLDDFLDAKFHERYWADPSVQKELARSGPSGAWEATSTGVMLLGSEQNVLGLVEEGLRVIQKVMDGDMDR